MKYQMVFKSVTTALVALAVVGEAMAMGPAVPSGRGRGYPYPSPFPGGGAFPQPSPTHQPRVGVPGHGAPGAGSQDGWNPSRRCNPYDPYDTTCLQLPPNGYGGASGYECYAKKQGMDAIYGTGVAVGPSIDIATAKAVMRCEELFQVPCEPNPSSASNAVGGCIPVLRR